MIRILLILFINFFVAGSLLAHPIYISITEVNYNSKTKNFELSVKCFADDLEKSISEWNKTQFSIEAKMPNDRVAFLSDYILANIDFKKNERSLEENFIGYEIENDVVFCYIEIKAGKEESVLSVKNTIMLNSIKEQENIMHFEQGEQKRSVRLNYSEQEESIVF